jgi:hypothetical protein
MSLAAKVVGYLKGIFNITVSGLTLTLGTAAMTVSIPGTFSLSNVSLPSAGVLSWNSDASVYRTAAGAIAFGTGAASGVGIISQPINTAAALTIQDTGNNAYYTVDSRTTVTGVKANLFGNAGPSFASAAGNTFNSVSIGAFTLTQSGVTTITALSGLSLNIASPTVTNASAGLTITTVSAMVVNGPLLTGNATGGTTITLDLPTYVGTGTTACGLRVAAPTGAGANYSLLLLQGGFTSLSVGGNLTKFYNTSGQSFVVIDHNNSVVEVQNNGLFGFSTSGSASGADYDTAIKRNAAGVIEVNNGSSGTFRDLKLRTLNQTGLTALYNNVATAGLGVPAIYGSGRATAQTAANASVATYTPAADGSFLVTANVLVTTSSAEAFTVTVSYTDEGNTARVLTFNFSLIAGTLSPNIAFANGAVPYEGIPLAIRAKAATAITIKTAAGGTYTGCTYNVEGSISQLAA